MQHLLVTLKGSTDPFPPAGELSDLVASLLSPSSDGRVWWLGIWKGPIFGKVVPDSWSILGCCAFDRPLRCRPTVGLILGVDRVSAESKCAQYQHVRPFLLAVRTGLGRARELHDSHSCTSSHIRAGLRHWCSILHQGLSVLPFKPGQHQQDLAPSGSSSLPRLSGGRKVYDR